MDLRPATPDDEAALTILLAASYRELLAGHYPEFVLRAALPFMTRANPALLKSGTYYVAEQHGRTAGCGGWTREKPGTGAVVPHIAHIRHFATHPDFARRGVGRLIAEHCIAEARRAGIRLLCASSTLPAEKFYACLGFVRERESETAFSKDVRFPSIEMVLRLEAIAGGDTPPG